MQKRLLSWKEAKAQLIYQIEVYNINNDNEKNDCKTRKLSLNWTFTYYI